MFCSGCGRKLEPNWVVCPCCAKPVQAVSSEAPVGQSKQEVECVSRGMGRGTLIVVILASIGVLLMGFVGSMSPEKFLAYLIVFAAYAFCGLLLWWLIVQGAKDDKGKSPGGRRRRR